MNVEHFGNEYQAFCIPISNILEMNVEAFFQYTGTF
jgi:hypothetical protein